VKEGSVPSQGAMEVSEDIPILVLRALSTKVVTVFCTGIKQITTGALAASASLNLTFWRLVSWLTGQSSVSVGTIRVDFGLK
jgi:hypothetical protein